MKQIFGAILLLAGIYVAFQGAQELWPLIKNKNSPSEIYFEPVGTLVFGLFMCGLGNSFLDGEFGT